MDWGLWIEDWGLGIGLMQITPNLPSFFHFIQKLLIFFWKKWKKKVNPAEVFCKYLVSTVDSGLAPLRGLIAAKDGSNWLGFKKPSIAVFGRPFFGQFFARWEILVFLLQMEQNRYFSYFIDSDQWIMDWGIAIK